MEKLGRLGASTFVRGGQLGNHVNQSNRYMLEGKTAPLLPFYKFLARTLGLKLLHLFGMWHNLAFLLYFATGIHACQREWYEPLNHQHNLPGKVAKRQNADFPPVLSEHETLLVNSFDNNTIDDWSYYYTHENKLAGLGKAAAQWTADRWAEFGFNSHLEEYHVYLSHPVSTNLQIIYGNGTTVEVNLVEDPLPEDDVTSRTDDQPTFHGYSASGDVTAEYVYVG